jgi:hypothetical protein
MARLESAEWRRLTSGSSKARGVAPSPHGRIVQPVRAARRRQAGAAVRQDLRGIIAKLHGELRVIGNDRDMRNEFVRLGLVPVESLPPDELKRFVASEIARWANVVREAGLAGSE